MPARVTGSISGDMESIDACISTARQAIRECNGEGGNPALLPHWQAMLKQFRKARRDLEDIMQDWQRAR